MAKQIINNGETGLVVRTKINENYTCNDEWLGATVFLEEGNKTIYGSGSADFILKNNTTFRH
jgi:hypothetical protein